MKLKHSNKNNISRLYIYPPLWSNLCYQRKVLYKKLVEIRKVYFVKNNKLKILDYGCGVMPYKEIFLNLTQEYIGADLNDNEYADIHFTNNGNINIDDNYFDVIISTQVLEHVKYPEKYIDECLRLLKKDGYLILSTHGHFIYHPVPNDYWRWTSEGLKLLLEQRGFTIIEIKGVMNLAATGLQYIQDFIRPKLFRPLQALFTFVMQVLIFFFDKLTFDKRLPDASIFVIIAKPNR